MRVRKVLIAFLLLISLVFIISVEAETDSDCEIAIGGKENNVVYVSDGASGNGLSPNSPAGNLNEAIKLLGSQGHIVVCGKLTLNSKTVIEKHDYPVTISSVYKGNDYRTIGAALDISNDLCLGGDTTFEHINLTSSKSAYIYAMANKLVMGNGISVELTNSNTSYPNICGGKNISTPCGRIDVTVNSGDWGILRGANNDTATYENGVDINITVGGGVFHNYVALASRGHISGGKITFTSTGGKFLRSVYVVYEQDGRRYGAEYDATLYIKGGEFHHEIAPAPSRSTEINGNYTVIIGGGDFSHLTDLIGTELYKGDMSSVLTVEDGMNINACEEGKDTFTNFLRPNNADPWLFYHDGFYYYTCTAASSISLIKVANISDLKTASAKVIVKPTNGINIWSPEIHHFSADEVGAENEGWYVFFGYDDGTTANQRAYVLKCKNGDDFFGDWINPVTGKINSPQKIEFPDAPTYNNNELCGGLSKMIVGGKPYVTFVSEVGRGTSDFHQTINITAIKNPWTFVGIPTTICVPEYSWEMGGFGYSSAKDAWYPKVVEGASAVYGDNGEVYLMYTGSGYWTIHYQLGYMRFTGGDPLDAANWKKNPRSILSLSSEVNGCGHGSYVKDNKGNYWVCYHGYVGKDTSSKRSSFIERIYVTSEGVTIGNGSGHPAPLDTVYTIDLNPMPLSKKISGFVIKADDPNSSALQNEGDGSVTTALETAVTVYDGESFDLTVVAVIGVAVLFTVAVLIASFVKKKASSNV